MTMEDRGGGNRVSSSRPSTAPSGAKSGRPRLGDLVVGGACIALMIGIFLPWFEFGSTLTGYFSFASIALRSWMYLAFFIALAVVGLLVLETIVPGFRPPLEHWLVFLACGANLVLTAVCFAKKAVGLDWDVGAYLSLVAAVAAALGALARRSRHASQRSPAPDRESRKLPWS